MASKQKNDDGVDFEYEIKDIYEFKGQLVVEVEHDYGPQKFGLSLKQKYLGDDGVPKWKKEIEDKLRRMYGDRRSDKSVPFKRVFQEELGKKKLPKGDN